VNHRPIPLTRRAAGLGALGVIALGARPAAAEEKLSVRLDFLPYGPHAAFYLALEKGWFREQGIAPTFDDGTGSPVTIQLVDAGQYDLGYASFASAMVARDNGMQVKAIAGALRKSDLGVVVDAGGSIHTPKDLEGKVIYYSPSSVETLFIDTWFKKNGVDKAKVNLTSIDIRTKVSTYMGGSGDGFLGPVAVYTIRQNIPRLSRAVTFADYGLPLPGFGLVASDAAMKAKGNAITGFIEAWQKAWAGIQDRTMLDEAVAAMLKNRPHAGLDPVNLRQQIDAVIPYISTPNTEGKPLLWQSPEDWAAGLKAGEEAGIIKPGANPSDFFTNGFVPKAA
jgi:NitT/TauT family transport system substrate-binding protein